ncbi:MAG: hypothetical protein OXB88_07435 [Bacteriovoracales bacterium]|nr:hypothetical protein [Bacteriovoracales bacterium]
MGNHLYFNFYGVWAHVDSPCPELLQRIELDFSHFHSPHLLPKRPHYQFYCEKSAPPWPKIPALAVSFQSPGSMTYDRGTKRYNDYYGKALSIYDYEMEEGKIYAKDLERLHEISYLMILSRVGKRLDMMGMHKVHAFGIIKNRTALLGIMPMKGGKSTHFLEFIKCPKVSILSDDTPLVSRMGKVLPFPIRVGLEEGNRIDAVNEAFVYQLNRQHYGKKTLVSMKGIPNPVGGDYDRLILIKGVRFNGPGCEIKKLSKWSMGIELFKFQVIGWGLPVIFEYFWESGVLDFARKSKIALSRLLASILLLWRSKTYTVFLGTDPQKNVEVISERLLKHE